MMDTTAGEPKYSASACSLAACLSRDRSRIASQRRSQERAIGGDIAAGAALGVRFFLLFTAGLLSEQPGVNMIGHGFESLVFYPLPVHAGHVLARVPHDEVNGGLVLDPVRHGAERVPQCVEPEPDATVDVLVVQ